MPKINCWEEKECGRQPGGFKVGLLGVCPAAADTRADGLNHGVNGGRACWPFSGTLCNGTPHGSFSSKLQDCLKCNFYGRVMREEGDDFVSASDVLSRLEN